MSAQTILAELKKQGIDLIAKDGKLLSKPPIPDQLLSVIKKHKMELIETLENERVDSIVTEEDFMKFFSEAIQRISDYWIDQPMPPPSQPVADEIANAEDQLNQAQRNRLSKAAFRDMVDRYIWLNTGGLKEEDNRQQKG